MKALATSPDSVFQSVRGVAIGWIAGTTFLGFVQLLSPSVYAAHGAEFAMTAILAGVAGAAVLQARRPRKARAQTKVESGVGPRWRAKAR